MLDRVLSNPLRRLWGAALFGLLCFGSILRLGLYRAETVDGVVYGTYLAVMSGFFWYGAAVLPLVRPNSQNDLFSAALNTGAAVFAAGSASFLVSYDKLPLVRAAFGFDG